MGCLVAIMLLKSFWTIAGVLCLKWRGVLYFSRRAQTIFQDGHVSAQLGYEIEARSAFSAGTGERSDGFMTKLAEVFKRLSTSELARMLLFT